MRAVSNLFLDRRSASAGFAGTCRRSFVRRSVTVVVVVVVGGQSVCTAEKHGFMYVYYSCVLLLLFYFAFTGYEEKVLNFTFNCKAYCWLLLARL